MSAHLLSFTSSGPGLSRGSLWSQIPQPLVTYHVEGFFSHVTLPAKYSNFWMLLWSCYFCSHLIVSWDYVVNAMCQVFHSSYTDSSYQQNARMYSKTWFIHTLDKWFPYHLIISCLHESAQHFYLH